MFERPIALLTERELSIGLPSGRYRQARTQHGDLMQMDEVKRDAPALVV